MSEKPEDFDAWVRGAYEDDEKPTPRTDALKREYTFNNGFETSWFNQRAAVAFANLAGELERQRDALAEALRECESVLRRVGCDITADRARALLGEGAG